MDPSQPFRSPTGTPSCRVRPLIRGDSAAPAIFLVHAAHYLLPLLMPQDKNAEKEIELHTAILAAETEDPNHESNKSGVERMRERLYNLRKQSDSDLIDHRSKRKALRAAGDSAIDNLIGTGKATRAVSRRLWSLTLRIWLWKGKRRSKRLRRQASLGDAAISMAKVLLAGVIVIVTAVIAVTVLTSLHVIFWRAPSPHGQTMTITDTP